MGAFGSWYEKAYAWACGRHPARRMAHFQWLSTRFLYQDLRRALSGFQGEILDIGCGDKPYGPWLPTQCRHFGIDVSPGPEVDLVIVPDASWPLDADRFDAVLCTQVIQYVRKPAAMLSEVSRVLKPGGLLALSAPFSYNCHAHLGDYWRYSAEGMAELLGEGFEVLEVRKEGGAGAFAAVPFLNWIDSVFSSSSPSRIAKGILLPLWIAFTILINGLGAALDTLDRTGRYYTNVLILARKR